MIEVCPDPEALARAVAEHVVLRAGEATTRSGRFTLALAGGSTPRAAYSLLASDEYVGRVDWSRVLVFWGDERCVPPDDLRSNYRMAREALLERVPLPTGNVHRILGEGEPVEAAAAYERLLRELLGGGSAGEQQSALDLVLLGMGPDGHTASLFPGKGAVREKVRWVVAECLEPPATSRITLTPVMLNAARDVCFVVSGADKAERLREVLQGPFTPDWLPAQSVRPTAGTLTWLVDGAAASRLA